MSDIFGSKPVNVVIFNWLNYFQKKFGFKINNNYLYLFNECKNNSDIFRKLGELSNINDLFVNNSNYILNNNEVISKLLSHISTVDDGKFKYLTISYNQGYAIQILSQFGININPNYINLFNDCNNFENILIKLGELSIADYNATGFNKRNIFIYQGQYCNTSEVCQYIVNNIQRVIPNAFEQQKLKNFYDQSANIMRHVNKWSDYFQKQLGFRINNNYLHLFINCVNDVDIFRKLGELTNINDLFVDDINYILNNNEVVSKLLSHISIVDNGKFKHLTISYNQGYTIQILSQFGINIDPNCINLFNDCNNPQSIFVKLEELNQLYPNKIIFYNYRENKYLNSFECYQYLSKQPVLSIYAKTQHEQQIYQKLSNETVIVQQKQEKYYTNNESFNDKQNYMTHYKTEDIEDGVIVYIKGFKKEYKLEEVLNNDSLFILLLDELKEDDYKDKIEVFNEIIKHAISKTNNEYILKTLLYKIGDYYIIKDENDKILETKNCIYSENILEQLVNLALNNEDKGYLQYYIISRIKNSNYLQKKETIDLIIKATNKSDSIELLIRNVSPYANSQQLQEIVELGMNQMGTESNNSKFIKALINGLNKRNKLRKPTIEDNQIISDVFNKALTLDKSLISSDLIKSIDLLNKNIQDHQIIYNNIITRVKECIENNNTKYITLIFANKDILQEFAKGTNNEKLTNELILLAETKFKESIKIKYDENTKEQNEQLKLLKQVVLYIGNPVTDIDIIESIIDASFNVPYDSEFIGKILESVSRLKNDIHKNNPERYDIIVNKIFSRFLKLELNTFNKLINSDKDNIGEFISNRPYNDPETFDKFICYFGLIKKTKHKEKFINILFELALSQGDNYLSIALYRFNMITRDKLLNKRFTKRFIQQSIKKEYLNKLINESRSPRSMITILKECKNHKLNDNTRVCLIEKTKQILNTNLEQIVQNKIKRQEEILKNKTSNKVHCMQDFIEDIEQFNNDKQELLYLIQEYEIQKLNERLSCGFGGTKDINITLKDEQIKIKNNKTEIYIDMNNNKDIFENIKNYSNNVLSNNHELLMILKKIESAIITVETGRDTVHIGK